MKEMTTAQKLLYNSRVFKIRQMEEQKEKLITKVAVIESKIENLKRLNAKAISE